MMEHMPQPFEDYDEELDGQKPMEGQEDDTKPPADAPPDQNAAQFVADWAIECQVGALVGDI